MKKTYIAYYRVSTTKQGDSGLGLSAQREAVNRFITGDKILVDEFQEIESGTKSDRLVLQNAIIKAKKTNSILLIAKLDRLSRNVKFIYTLQESGVEFVCADMPDANNLTIGLLSVLAQEEAQRTSERTKAALQEIKSKINKGETHISKSGNIVKRLGSPQNLSYEARLKGAAVRSEKARNNKETIKTAAFISSLFEQDYSFAQITKKLNENGFKTSTGKIFKQTQVKRIYDQTIFRTK